jgi:excisionase family DNA binding protein
MKLLTASEVASILKVSRARVYELARTRAVPSITLGLRQIRFDEDSLRDWINRSIPVPLAPQEGAN